MSSSDSPIDRLHDLIRWAKETQGVLINGIDGARFPDRGYGIKATQNIRKGDRLMFVPAKALITIQTPFVKALKLPRSCTVHGRLAAALTLASKREDREFRIWEKTWPSQADVRSLPLLWTDPEAHHLPNPAQDILRKQRTKIQIDRLALRGSMDSETINSDLYTYYWLVVSSRCFYWDYPTLSSRGRKPANRRRTLPPDDCMALCPVADCFNHADEGCDFDSDVTGCWVTADRDYGAGDEVFVSYGKHSNDFLLVEYGFILTENRWDVVKLDDFIVPSLNASQQQVLEEFGLLGDFSLDHNGICHRTESALRGSVMAKQRWRKFLTGDYDGEDERGAVSRRLDEVRTAFDANVQQTLRAIRTLPQSSSKEVLLMRWAQMANLVNAAGKACPANA